MMMMMMMMIGRVCSRCADELPHDVTEIILVGNLYNVSYLTHSYIFA